MSKAPGPSTSRAPSVSRSEARAPGRGPRPGSTPLAWLSLVHDRRRFLAAAIGVAFAVVLMLVELGFLFAIYDSSTLVIEAFDADLVVVDALKDDTNPSKPFPRSVLARARAVDGVADASALYLSRWADWRSQGSATRDKLRVLAWDPSHPALRLPSVLAQQHLLTRDDTALYDRRLRDSFDGGLRAGGVGELRGRRVRLVGDFELGPDLEMNATLIVSERTFRNVFHQPGAADPLEQVDFGLVRLEPEAELEPVRAALRERLGPRVRVAEPSTLVAEIHRFWTRNKPVGGVFGLGVLVGFVIGIMICYQILFTDVVDHLAQFATLRAMGYTRGYLRGLAVRRGLYLALAASALGLPAGLALYGQLGRITGLTFRFGAGRALLVVAATASMCALASWLAMRKAIDADPADVF